VTCLEGEEGLWGIWEAFVENFVLLDGKCSIYEGLLESKEKN
jgi:hypothetical protein